MRREMKVVVEITNDIWGDTLEEIAEGMTAEYLHPAAVVFDAVDPVGEVYLATLTEYHDDGTVRTTTLWSTEADAPATRLGTGRSAE